MIKKFLGILLLIGFSLLFFFNCSLAIEESEMVDAEQEVSAVQTDDAAFNSRAAASIWKEYIGPTITRTLTGAQTSAYFNDISAGKYYYSYNDSYYSGTLQSKTFRMISSPVGGSNGLLTFSIQIVYRGYIYTVNYNEIGRYTFNNGLIDELIMGPGTQYGRTYEYLPGIHTPYETGTPYGVTFYNSGSAATYVNDYVQLPNTIFSNEFTVSLWTYFRYNSNPQYEAAIYSFGRCLIEDSFILFVKPDGNAYALIASNFKTSRLYWYSTPQVKINDNKWHHLAATYKNRVLSFYADGRLIGSRTLASTHVPHFYNLRQFIALHEWYTGSYRRSSYNGTVDSLRIFSKALSYGQISTIYSGENP